MVNRDERTNTRATLLNAADSIVLRNGASTLTLDAVARDAGVSKGGVLYHFPTKDALIRAMAERASDRFELDMLAQVNRLPASPGRWTRAYLTAALHAETRDDDISTAANAGLLAAVATNPRLLEPLRDRYAHWQSQIEVDGIDPAIGTLIRLAMDGLWMADMLSLVPPDARTRVSLQALMLQLIEQGKDDAP